MPTRNIADLDAAQSIGWSDAGITRDAANALALGNFVFDVDQSVGAGQDNYVLTYDNSSGLISLEAAAGGFTEADLDSVDNAQAIGWSDALFDRIAADEVSPPKLVDMPLGSNASPSIRPTGSSISGFYWATATNIAIAVSGVQRFLFGSGGLLTTSGGVGFGPSAGNPGGVLLSSAAGVIQVGGNAAVNTGATFEMIEMTAPSAPAANRVRLYAEDDGSGKTRLMALFATGAAQQIAIEP